MKIKKVLITGGAGFIGSHLADALVLRGCKVFIIDNLLTGDKKNINPKAVFFNMSIEDTTIENVFKKVKPDIVFHFAARVNVAESIRNPKQDVQTNIWGSLNVLENCKKFNVKKVIFASSCAVYGQAQHIPTSESDAVNPASPYAIAKYTIENYLKISGLPFVALRFSNVYGPRQKGGVVSIFCKALLADKNPIIYDGGRQTRDFVYIADVVEATIRTMELRVTGILNIGSGVETSISKLFDIIAKKLEKPVKKKYAKLDHLATTRSCLDCKKAKKELGWSPKYSLEQGILTILS